MPAAVRLPLASLFIALWAGIPSTQAADPQLQAVFPLGCRPGESVEVVLTGNDDLKAATALVFSHNGLRAERLEENRFRITVDADVPVRDYDVWAVTPGGASNARRFVVSDLPEFVEDGGHDDRRSAQVVSVPGAVSGKIDGGPETDWYAFHADAKTAVTIACLSHSLDGSVAPALTIIGPDGRELMHSTGNRPEPVLHLAAPETGTYSVRVVDRAYQSDPSSVYRLIVTSGPYVVGAFPHVLANGQSQQVTLYGFQLPGGTPQKSADWNGLQTMSVDIEPPAEGDLDGGGWLLSPAALLDGFRYRHPQTQGSLRFSLCDDVVVVETESANNDRSRPPTIPVPCRIVGLFAARGDVDRYRISAQKGESFAIDAFGERLGRPMDLDVSIHDAEGKLLTTLKDVATPKGFPAAVPLDSLDAQGVWKAPADGDYDLVVRDLYGGSVFGPDRAYEVMIGPTSSAFRVIALSAESRLIVPSGGAGKLKLVAVHRDGFKQPIRIRAEGLPAGVTASECVIASGKREATLTLTAAAEAVPGIGTIHLLAEAEFDDKTVAAPVRGTTFLQGDRPPARFTDGILLIIQAPKES